MVIFKVLQVYTKENRFFTLLKILVQLILVPPTCLHIIPYTDTVFRCIFCFIGAI